MARGGMRVLASAVALAGCGGGGSGSDPPLPAFERAAFDAFAALPEAEDLPLRGSARYAGGFAADIRRADITPSGEISGALTLDVDFAAAPATLPVEGRLHDITGSFLGSPVRIDELPLVPGAGRLVLTETAGGQAGQLAAGFGASLPLSGADRRINIAIDGPLRGTAGRALAGPLRGTILAAPYTDQPHVLTGRFHAATD